MPGIVFNETEKDLIYARADIGGAYRWDPSTETWIPLLDHFQMDEYSYYGVESIATDPVDPNRVYIAAGMYTNDWLPNMEQFFAQRTGEKHGKKPYCLSRWAETCREDPWENVLRSTRMTTGFFILEHDAETDFGEVPTTV